MITAGKYDKISIGVATGFLFPLVIGLLVYVFSAGDRSIAEYIHRIVRANILTHSISLCVFPNIFLFLFFNRLDMLHAARGVLGVTIFWALVVFAVKFLL